ncbi:MAG: CFI-box-CTERM domain-containing protein [Dehalococcoidia bacterium]
MALCLMAGGVMPAYADEPPPMPHQFYGTVSLDGNPVQQGTLVEAFVDDVKQAETTVDAEGRYGYNPIFRVSGTAGTTVTFHVGGVEADEDATWESGEVQQLNLTIHEGGQPPVQYELTISSTSGGSVTTPGEGVFPYYAGTLVHLVAEAETGYGFVNWTANPTVAFGDASAAETTFTMPSQPVTIVAHFGVTYELDMAADPVAGGEAIDVAAEGAYVAGATISIRAEPASGYGFVNWTADGSVTFQDATAQETTLVMPAYAVTVIAHFGVAYNLTMAADPVGGGNAIDVANKGAYAAGATVRIRAVANPGYAFGNWTADATVTFGSITATETTFTMLAQALTVTAHFEEALPPPEVPTVTTLGATSISSYAGTIHMSYTVGYFIPVEVRFACKRLTDPAWFYTTWVSRTAGGNYTEVLSGLVSQTQYQFKAQLKYNGTVIEGDISQFTTAAGSGSSLNDLLGSFGCFVATAAYGTPGAEQILVLREFRDVVLLKSRVGSRFVALYYKLSPPIAEFVAGNEVLRTLVRELLVDPIVWLVEATGDTWRT